MREGVLANRTPRPIPHASPIHLATFTNNIIAPAAGGGPFYNLWLDPDFMTNTAATAATTVAATVAVVVASD